MDDCRYLIQTVSTDSWSAFIKLGNSGRQYKLPPAGALVWTGLVQPVCHTPALPTGPVQEAAWHRANTGGHDGVQPVCCKVRKVIWKLTISHK